MPRAGGGWRGRHPDRDLPGPVADQGGGERRQDRAATRPGRDTPIFVQVTVETTGTLLVGPDIAAAATVVHALDVPLIGPELRHRAAGDGGARALAGGELAGPAVGAAECRSARAGGWRDTLPAGRRASMAIWMERFVQRGRAEPDRRLLRYQHRRIFEALDAMLARKTGARLPPGAHSAQARSGSRAVASLYGQTAAAAGEQLLLHRRALQREWFQEVAASSRSRATGTAASAMGREQIAEGSNSLDICTAFVGRNELVEMSEVMTRFTGSVNTPLVIDSTETPMHRGRAEAAWRQGDHQLDQFRGRRAGRRMSGWCWPRSSARR